MVHIRFIFFQTFPNSGNAIKNAKKVLWNISDSVFVEKRQTEITGEVLIEKQF